MHTIQHTIQIFQTNWRLGNIFGNSRLARLGRFWVTRASSASATRPTLVTVTWRLAADDSGGSGLAGAARGARRALCDPIAAAPAKLTGGSPFEPDRHQGWPRREAREARGANFDAADGGARPGSNCEPFRCGAGGAGRGIRVLVAARGGGVRCGSAPPRLPAPSKGGARRGSMPPCARQPRPPQSRFRCNRAGGARSAISPRARVSRSAAAGPAAAGDLKRLRVARLS